MPPPRSLVSLVVREWVTKAENDLQAAAHLLKLGQKCPTDTVGFHAQQCVEKYLKALLVHGSIDFPWTHDLKTLCHALPRARRPTLDAQEQAMLTDFAVRGRYPGWPEITLAEARQAVAIARRLRKEVRRGLPRAALRRAVANLLAIERTIEFDITPDQLEAREIRAQRGARRRPRSR